MQGERHSWKERGEVLNWLGFPDSTSRDVLASYFRPWLPGIALFSVLTSVVSLSFLPVLWLLQKIFDVALPDKDVPLLLQIAGVIIGIRIVTGLITLLLRRLAVGIIKGAVAGLRRDLLARTASAPLRRFSAADRDRLHTRIVTDTERIDTVSNALLSGMLPSGISSCVVLALLWHQSPMLTLVGAVTLPAVWMLSRASRLRLQQIVGGFQRDFESFSKNTSFALRHTELARTQGFEAGELARQGATIDALERQGVRMSMAFALHHQVQFVVASCGAILLLVLGGIEVIEGRMTLGALAAFYFGAGMLYGFVGSWLGAAADVAAGRDSFQRIAALLDEPNGETYAGSKTIDFKGGFCLQGVGYQDASAEVLCDINLRIDPGARVAIIGDNGSGKTTLLHILLGLIRPVSGRALADGHDYETLDISALRRQIGVVMQHPAFFHGSLRDNISYGEPDASDADVSAAIDLAGARELVSSLPDGYHTIIGDGGVTLSGGECQRLAIARALLRRPRALILDEPTNHLDVGAVRELMTALDRLPDRPTVILVSHDPRVLDYANDTYVLESRRLRCQPAMRTASLASAQAGE